eukprot:CAMPEP_0170541634 /NCGR_PEP_ID=MMETSP0211-20121228/1319_1 /TAXON_ID=311385 /ORGANISM="Pseudokeronopsis sp., Strain OXSARD2" /LENGTH=51 /DNA_ID=CAMNT_0010844445 /DNA_START=516 /DNA_END=674 /DNA_ORIENTATION=-
MFFNKLKNEDGTMKEGDELKKIMTEHGVDFQKPIINYCQIGVGACVNFAAM